MPEHVTHYIWLLLQLHKLIALGQGDGPEADALCDEMDAPWHASTDQERELFRNLSESLYVVHDSKKIISRTQGE